jgi:hypothetical protein
LIYVRYDGLVVLETAPSIHNRYVVLGGLEKALEIHRTANHNCCSVMAVLEKQLGARIRELELSRLFQMSHEDLVMDRGILICSPAF